jgi:hypothetical protein
MIVVLMIFCLLGWWGGSQVPARHDGATPPPTHSAPVPPPLAPPCNRRQAHLVPPNSLVRDLTVPFADRRADTEIPACP